MYLITLPWQHDARAVAEAGAEEPPSLQSRTLKVSASLLSLWLPLSFSFVALLEFNYGTQVEETKISQPKGNRPNPHRKRFHVSHKFPGSSYPLPTPLQRLSAVFCRALYTCTYVIKDLIMFRAFYDAYSQVLITPNRSSY